VERRGRGRRVKKGMGEGKGEEMTQTLYAHMNKRKKKKSLQIESHEDLSLYFFTVLNYELLNLGLLIHLIYFSCIKV
jgi:hypothetical protein